MKKFRLWILLVLLLAVIAGARGYSYLQRHNIKNTSGKSDQPLGPSVVSIIQSSAASASEISEYEIDKMVQNAVKAAGGLEGVIKDGDTVVLKPNLVAMREAEDSEKPPLMTEVNGISTDWRVTKAAVRLVRTMNPHGKIYVMEGSADDKTKNVMKYLKYTHEFIPGVDEFLALEEDSGAWHDYASPGLVKISLPDGLLHKEYYLNKKYAQADVLISLPVLKNHSCAVISGAIKNVGIGATPANIYGMTPDFPQRSGMVNHNNDDLHKWIRDYYLCRKVDYVIMDGLQGLQNGPVHRDGDIKKDQMNMRLICAGKDAVSVDTIEALIMGWDPKSVNHLRYLNEAGAGNIDISRITIAGDSIEKVRKNFEGVVPAAGGSKFSFTTPSELNSPSTSTTNEGS